MVSLPDTWSYSEIIKLGKIWMYNVSQRLNMSIMFKYIDKIYTFIYRNFKKTVPYIKVWYIIYI